ncbi:adenosine deaminase family protein [Undibacterium terreum]|uniref:adenosine deaminase n=1 Tax=Undibacterium terreum TaxID=1224302 RepID=A0A916UEZ3_9BURK|nr:adenosine deaminase [Undibacterium terreum]GGC69921.1 adenosine deaminase [Undibacterium terreum]
MKNKSCEILICSLLPLLVAGHVLARTPSPPAATKNTLVTSQYYARLIAGPVTDLARLNLFVSAMPKGGDLHHHYSGAIYAETYLDWVGKRNFCIYRDNVPQLKAQKYHIEARSDLPAAAKAVCASADEVRQDNGFYRELLQRWSDKDYDNHSHDQTPPDQQFFDTFAYFGPISDEYFREGLQWLKDSAKAENMQYLETMLKSGPNVALAGMNADLDALTSASSDEQVEQVLRAYYAALIADTATATKIKEYADMVDEIAAGIDDADFTMRFQAFAVRGFAPSRVFASLYSSFAAAHMNKLIVGVNIVGPENGIVAMRDYTLHMKMFRFLKQRFPDVKLALHAGELTLSMVPPDGLQSHIAQAIQIAGANRIGHGIDITYEAHAYELMDSMKQLDIPVEVNLSSNAFILGVKNEAHPVTAYKAHGVPFVISTDDAGVSRSTMSNEYLLYASRYKPSYAELKATVYNSIRYSFLSDKEKQDQLQQLNRRFSNFEEKIRKLASPAKK